MTDTHDGAQHTEGTGAALVRVAGDTFPAAAPAPLAFHRAALLETWLAGKNAGTVRAYRADLEAFARWARMPSAEAALEAFLALAAPDANAAALQYRGALLEAGLAPATINRRFAALRSVVSLARLVGRVAWALEVPGVETTAYRDTRGPGVAGVRAMARALDGRQDAKGARDRAVLRLLFELALRRAEVVELDLAHFDRAAGTLSVLGKQRREREARTVPLGAVAALEAWLAFRGAAPGPLFPNFDPAGKGDRLTGRSVARIIGDAGEAAGVGRVRPHGLRHASITAALDAGADVREVQKHSRHRDLRTLTLYDDNRADLAGRVAALVSGLLA